MQDIATFRTVIRGAIQIVVLAAVAAAGVSVGRWVVPEEGSTGAPAVRYVNSGAPAGGQDVMARKLAQMDAEDARHGTVVAGASSAPAVSSSESVVQRKLAQMDALDSRVGTQAINRRDIMGRKFAQMDAEDAR